ncbi:MULTISPECIES: SusC/RagA family TonB-linked outer membrane protein [Niastella]|uniref:SusC/RagA family TonB-linked outer membrane protein n=1 Tax=Niastella soli TaxID=2821487 RepID=A0ABS3Z5J0_9BACT|nr:SusC/RagA family TonB-linked outer membrane protein [Niastella soli]MBO9205002.1 SusC/RagA family TonB-linked outer membrane protein [Niastella soli]
MIRIWLFLILLVCISGFAQAQYTISVDNVPLKKLLRQVQRSGKFYFTYRSDFVPNANVSVHVKNGTIEQVLEQAFKGLGLEYIILDSMITVRPDSTASRLHPPEQWTIAGMVINEAGEPLVMVSVQETGRSSGTTSTSDGKFTITVKPNTRLTFSSVGYEPVEKLVKDKSSLTIQLKHQVKDLDETVITGYGKTSKRYNTGSIFKVNSVDIARQPVSDPLAALQGRVPGLLITQSNGLPGSSFKIQLRGQSSIGINPGYLPPNDPLFIIDGVPYANNNNLLQTVASGSALGDAGRSLLSFINISDIDHIEVLKDADATAIYGSRGSNGVILISTKKGKPGPPLFTFNINTGFSRITRYPTMLNTGQYVQMRREALENDSLPIDNLNAPDLVTWDTARYTDFKKMLIGGEAVTSNVQLSAMGGSKRLQYFMGTAVHRETTVFPGDLNNRRISGHINLHYQNRDSNFNVTLSVIGLNDRNKSISNDLTSYVNLAPNTPVLYDSLGKLNWIQGDLPFINPLSHLLKTYESTTNNVLGNLDLSYRLVKNLVFKTNIGYNRLQIDELSLQPASSQSPVTVPDAKGSSNFGKIRYNSWIAEPQLEYNRYLGIGKISALVGTTMQVQEHTLKTTKALNFPDGAQLRNAGEADSIFCKKAKSEYRYGGVFARLNSVLCDKYLINLTGRSDASSRFGPGKQVGNFWSAGAGWLFSNEPFIKDHLSFVSFGKLRASYGVTGNDQIGDYKYLDKWQDVDGAYLGNRGITPVQLADSNYSWEVSHKLEAALELGLMKDRLMISVAYFRNRTGNQLISYSLPGVTGFLNYAAKNSPALVQNTGWEIQLQAKNRFNQDWQWYGNVLLTIPKNKLIAFPNLASSSYASNLVIGKSLSVLTGYSYTGVNKATGIFEFYDQDGDGEINSPGDYRILGNFDPVWYGSVQNNLQYKGWQLDVFFEFRKQRANGYRYSMYSHGSPGATNDNQSTLVLNRWTQNPDNAGVQQLTTGVNDKLAGAIDKFMQSDGTVEDASFCRLRNIELSWRLPAKWLQQISVRNCRLYLQAQNLFTITPYKGTDPETQNIFTLPPLRTMAAGIELSF